MIVFLLIVLSFLTGLNDSNTEDDDLIFSDVSDLDEMIEFIDLESFKTLIVD
jgi:hypothetical protein